RRQAETRVEEQEGIQRFLADVSTTLSAKAIDYEETLASLSSLAVPRLGDWATVHVRRPDGRIERLGIAHADAGSGPLARELESLEVEDDPERPPIKVMLTGEPLLFSSIKPEDVADAARDDRERELLQSAKVSSVMVVPLAARDRIL